MGLPALASFAWPRRTRAAACPAAAPKRFVGWYFPCGVYPPAFFPATAGKAWELTDGLAPLETKRDKILVVTGLQNQDVARPALPPGNHGGGTGCFLTQVRTNNNYGDPNRTSIDQILAQQLGTCTRLSSLQLGFQSGGGCDDAPCQFSQNISWLKNTPLAPTADLGVIFNRLFAGLDRKASDGDAARRLALDTSVLDFVLEDLKALSGDLSRSDRRKLDEYATGVRELEQRVRAPGGGSTGACPLRAGPPAGGDLNKQMDAMTDLMALAFQCDATRVVSMMTGTSASSRNFSFIGTTGATHHQNSHHQESAGKVANFKKIVRWEMEQFAKLVTKLDRITDVDGKSVLDNTVAFCSSEIADGDRHGHWDLPVVLAGSGGGFFKTGEHALIHPRLSYSGSPGLGGRSKIADLFVSILQAFGNERSSIGNSSGPLRQVHRSA